MKPSLSLLAGLFLMAPLLSASESITVVRDMFGVAHVYAPSDAGAAYGAGYACAKDRWLQMCLNRLEYKGRYSEFFGVGPSDKHLKWDRFARRVGLARLAAKEVADMPVETLALLQAYADGVNRWVTDHPTEVNPEFSSLFDPLHPALGDVQADWTPQDCVGVWLRMSVVFQQWGGREQPATQRFDEDVEYDSSGNVTNWAELEVSVFNLNMFDDTAVSVLPEDYTPADVQALEDFQALYGIPDHPGGTLGSYTPPGFSEGAAIGASRMQSGHAVVIGAPRVAVTWPNSFYESSMEGETFTARGWTIPGSLNYYSGSSATNAWSPQSMELDMSDVFTVTVSAAGDTYWYDGAWRPFEVEQDEDILVDGQLLETVTYRETAWGPDVTLVPRIIADPDYGSAGQSRIYCLRTSLHDDRAPRSTTAGFIDMYRADTLEEFYDATEGWVWPSVNMVFANEDGRVGYTTVGAAPVRTKKHPFAGHMIMDGSSSGNAWQTFVPHELRPHVLDPVRGWVSNGNNMAIGSWYPLLNLFPKYGDNSRARIIRELASQDPGPGGLTDAQAEDILRNKVNSNVRDVVRIGVTLRDQGVINPTATPAADAVLDLLEPWWSNGSARHVLSTHPGVLPAWLMKTKSFNGNTPSSLITNYGSGTPGLCNFLKQTIADLDAGITDQITADEATEIINILEATRAAELALGIPESEYLDHYQEYMLSGELERWEGINLPALDNEPPLAFGPVRCAHIGTLLAVTDSSYSQFVKLGVIDGAKSILALGVSERLDDDHELDQMTKWGLGQLKPSPTTFDGVKAMGPWSRVTVVIP